MADCVLASIVTAPLLLSMYGEVLSAANPAVLLSNLHKSLVHPVMADPWSIAPKTSQVGAKRDLLVRLKLQQDNLSVLQTASQDEKIAIQLTRGIAALQTELPRWRRLLFFFSGNGRLLNQFRFACFFVVALVLSSVLLYVLSTGGSTKDPPGSKVVDDAGVGSVYGMLQTHCEHVPANIDGAYFDFWTIWVLIMAYCAVSALFVSRVLLQDLALELLKRFSDCICFICYCQETKSTQPAGQSFLFYPRIPYLLTCIVLLCSL
jgi:hypothetical protein